MKKKNLRVLGIESSCDETAAALEMTPGAVRVAQHRAIMSLRAMLAGAEGGHS